MINFDNIQFSGKATGSSKKSTHAMREHSNSVADFLPKQGKQYDTAMKMSQRTKWFFENIFSPERLEQELQRKNGQSYKAYKGLIDSRIQANGALRMEDALEGFFALVVENYESEFSYSYGEIKTLCKGIRSQVLRELKDSKKGFNKAFLTALVRELEKSSTVRRLLKELNPVRVWVRPSSLLK